jgi:hypothetical protein
MTLQPTRKSKKGHYRRKGRTVYVDMGIWHNKKTGHIHIAGPRESKFHSTVSDNHGLYKRLKEILKRENCW